MNQTSRGVAVLLMVGALGASLYFWRSGRLSGEASGCGGGPDCEAPLIRCANACADVSTDISNCGACNNTCLFGQVCALGKCVSSCSEGETLCSSSGTAAEACANLASDNAHCGACDNKCGEGHACKAGKCEFACATGATYCGGSECVNLQMDRAHCGSCENACGTGQVCSGGVCETSCDPPFTHCRGSGTSPAVCANLQTSNAHCGACNIQCATPERCVDAKCQRGSPSDACQEATISKNADGLSTIVCTRFYENGPIVHAPNDGQGAFYGALALDGKFVTRDGVKHRMVAADGTTTIECGVASDTPGCAASIWAPLHRVGHRRTYVIYKITGTRKAGTTDLVVTRIDPWLTAVPEATAGFYEFTYEGTASLRNPTPTTGFASEFAGSTTAKVRLKLVGRFPAVRFADEEENEDQATVPVEFAIENLNTPARGADGSCIPALTSYGTKNPFYGAMSDRLTMSLAPSMHVPGDDHVIVEPHKSNGGLDPGTGYAFGSSSMDIGAGADSLRFHPQNWMKPSINLSHGMAMRQRVHGTPNGFEFDIHPVSSGGGACVP